MGRVVVMVLVRVILQEINVILQPELTNLGSAYAEV